MKKLVLLSMLVFFGFTAVAMADKKEGVADATVIAIIKENRMTMDLQAIVKQLQDNSVSVADIDAAIKTAIAEKDLATVDALVKARNAFVQQTVYTRSTNPDYKKTTTVDPSTGKKTQEIQYKDHTEETLIIPIVPKSEPATSDESDY